jgi:hypothetical protein
MIASASASPSATGPSPRPATTRDPRCAAAGSHPTRDVHRAALLGLSRASRSSARGRSSGSRRRSAEWAHVDRRACRGPGDPAGPAFPLPSDAAGSAAARPVPSADSRIPCASVVRPSLTSAGQTGASTRPGQPDRRSACRRPRSPFTRPRRPLPSRPAASSRRRVHWSIQELLAEKVEREVAVASAAMTACSLRSQVANHRGSPIHLPVITCRTSSRSSPRARSAGRCPRLGPLARTWCLFQ